MVVVERPGQVFVYNGVLAEVVGIGEGKTISFVIVGEPPCPTCGHNQMHLLEQSPRFQDNARPADTLREV